ncbi:ABC-2 type transport system permease protein [Virgibacillus natechei]|uniref:ABC-2 type transport system permease protein n=1 Tax=Virgibacillus natechei TaxID=1216297 RepID=A0ABS4IGV4_9BACI|nr:ABC-2 transporter permease [Virgibacillus natechei]MBP1970184.1 ABC-2 type transport system permease protein [Virgibacillus natechei]UZD12864.1 ABC-2 transporter permease [Virgibacillus natechei]
MFNLIRRDVILQKWLLLTFIPVIVFFVIMDSHPVLTFLVASVFIPFNAFAYDEKAETNILLNSLPYTRKEIIASRYFGAIVYMILAIGVTSLALFVSSTPFAIQDIAIAIGLFLLFASFTFPLFYIFKPGYIFYVVLISFLLLAGIGPPIVLFLAENLTAITDFIYSLSIPVIYTGAAVIVIFFYAVSWGVTTIIYQRKAF